MPSEPDSSMSSGMEELRNWSMLAELSSALRGLSMEVPIRMGGLKSISEPASLQSATMQEMRNMDSAGEARSLCMQHMWQLLSLAW